MLMICTNNLGNWQDQDTGRLIDGPAFEERVNIIGRSSGKLMSGDVVDVYKVEGYPGMYWAVFFRPIDERDTDISAFEEILRKHGKTKEEV